jgi:hypothetical protein
MNPDVVHYFFALAPWVVFIAIIWAVWSASRGAAATAPYGMPIGKTYACAKCGKRGKHEHMVPATERGYVVWYCSHCTR